MRHLIWLGCSLLVACTSRPYAESGWELHVALETQAKLGGCVVADLDPRHAGNEIAVTASTGHVYCVRRVGAGWATEIICHQAGEMIQVAAGDLDPEHPGDELVCVGSARGGEDAGGKGAAHYAWRTAQGWQSEEIAVQGSLIHGVAVGDFDRNREGLEVMIAGYERKATVLARVEGGWSETGSVGIGSRAKGVAAGLAGAVIVCDDGALVEVRQEGAGYAMRRLARYPAPLARVHGDPRGVLFCANDGTLRRWEAGKEVELYRSSDRLRGAVRAELDGSSRGEEIATAGYTGEFTVLSTGEGSPLPMPRAVAWSEGKLHHLAVGTLPGLGPCLVGCGYSGRLLVVRNHERGSQP